MCTSLFYQSKFKEDATAAQPIVLDDVEVNFFFTLFLRFPFSFCSTFFPLLSFTCLLSFLFIYLFFQTEDDPIPVESAPVVANISISEGVLVEPVPSVEVVSVEASIFAERKDSATADAPMEKFPTETDIIADTRIFATNVTLGDVSAHRDYHPYGRGCSC